MGIKHVPAGAVRKYLTGLLLETRHVPRFLHCFRDLQSSDQASIHPGFFHCGSWWSSGKASMRCNLNHWAPLSNLWPRGRHRAHFHFSMQQQRPPAPHQVDRIVSLGRGRTARSSHPPTRHGVHKPGTLALIPNVCLALPYIYRRTGSIASLPSLWCC